jgi:organic radical activating enzyme/TusA-related sulfurtransferase
LRGDMPLGADIELKADANTFASGLLVELIAALRRTRPGDLVAVTSPQRNLGAELETWCRFTRNSLVETTVQGGRYRWVIRNGEAPASLEDDRPIGSRLWLYTNFDCNLRCDYCCVRSSPKAPRRALGLDRVRRIAKEAAALDVGEIFVTGGEPFLLADIGEILAACAAAAPTTVLTNGMLLVGRRLEALRASARERVTLQISLDSPTAERHDHHRGAGTWAKAWRGIEQARAGKATPSFKLGTEIALRAGHSHEIAWARATQCINEFDEQAGRKCLRVSVELDIRSQWHIVALSRHSYKSRDASSVSICKFADGLAKVSCRQKEPAPALLPA